MIFALNRIGIRLGDAVVIQGAGALGLYAAALAKEMGASKVIVVDLVEERLKMSEDFGADVTINGLEHATEEDRIRRVNELTGNRGADVVVEVAGVPNVIPEGLRMVRKSGGYLEVGCVYENSVVPIDISTISLSGLRVVGTFNYEYWCLPRALEFLRDTRDRYPYGEMLTRVFPLSEVNRAIESADKKTAVRAALRL